MNILSFWAARTVRGMQLSGCMMMGPRLQQVEYCRRHDRHVRRHWDMRFVQVVRGPYREKLNLRSNRRAEPSWAADRARLMPLP